jgi:hypothetical protein
MKQLTCQNTKIVEKVIENENGLFLARFQIVEAAGNIRWKLIEITPISAPVDAAGEILLIEAPVVGEVYIIDNSHPKKENFTYSSLSFFVSQPTRAPNF